MKICILHFCIYTDVCKLLDSLNKNDIFSKKLFYFIIKVVYVQILVFDIIPLILKHHFYTLRQTVHQFTQFTSIYSIRLYNIFIMVPNSY